MLAHLLASPDLPDDIGAPARYAASPAARREQEAAAAVIARDRAWSASLCTTDEVEARDAFERTMHEYGDRLVRFAYGFVASADAAEDVVQDVFLRVWARRRTIRPDESLRAYLFTAVRRTALNLIKRRTVEARYVSHSPSDAVQTITVDEQLDAESIAAALRAALSRLPERRRTALRLRYEEQLPFADVANIMGLSEKSVKHLVTRAVEELRRYVRRS